MVKAELVHQSSNPKTQSKEDIEESIENIASVRNDNENDRHGSLITVVNDLSAKFSCFKQKSEAFTQDFKTKE